MMAAPQMMAAASAAAASAEEAAAPEVIQTEFTVKLTGFDAKAKLKIIKQLKTSLELPLNQAKTMAESVPVDLAKDVSKDEAEKMAKIFEELGGPVKID